MPQSKSHTVEDESKEIENSSESKKLESPKQMNLESAKKNAMHEAGKSTKNTPKSKKKV